jgi:hypothetical protein
VSKSLEPQVSARSGPEGVGGEEEVLGAGETVGVSYGGGSDRAGVGVRRRGGTYKSSSAPTPLTSLTSQCLSAAFLVRFMGGAEGAGGYIDGEGSRARGDK